MCITIFWQRETHVGAPRGVSDVEHSPNVTTVRGVDTLLNCRVHQLTNMTVSWIKHGGVHLLAVGRYIVIKKSKFPRYKMKCRGKRDTTRNMQRSISFSRYISCYPVYVSRKIDYRCYHVRSE